MAFTLIDKQWSISDFIHEYVCDTESDVANLPECRPGSKAINSVSATGFRFGKNHAAGSYRYTAIKLF